MQTQTEIPLELAAGGSEPRSARTSCSESNGSGRSLSSWFSSDGAGVVVHPSWQRVFERFDTDRNGLLDVAEVSAGLRILLGLRVTDSTLKATMLKFDKDKSGQLDIIEFVNLIKDLKVSRKSHLEPMVLQHKGSILGLDQRLPLQDLMFRIFHNKFVSILVALCIIGNFIINVLEKQIDPDIHNQKYHSVWFIADVTFNILFLLELLANMWSYGGPVMAFWASGWNVFETIIVTVGVLTMANDGERVWRPLRRLKLMRTFRIFRLFQRVESLNKIIVALLNSIPGVCNAFMVMLVFFCIYAIVGVGLFRDFGEGAELEAYNATTGITTKKDAMTARGYFLGIEYYGTFMRAFYTLFQVMTGDSWSEAIARPLLFGSDGQMSPSSLLFFISFVILTQMVLINVVVAVLLDKFVANEPTDQDEDIVVDVRLASRDSKDEMAAMNTKLDQVIHNFSTLCNSLTELNASVADLKNRIDHQDQSQVMGVSRTETSI